MLVFLYITGLIIVFFDLNASLEPPLFDPILEAAISRDYLSLLCVEGDRHQKIGFSLAIFTQRKMTILFDKKL